MSTGNTSPRAGVIIIADDLTGACDAAVAFSCRGTNTEVVLNWRNAGDVSAEVVAIDTESREIPVHEAVKKLEAAARQLDLNRFAHIFKKIDSVFRGNTFDEIAAAVREFPSDLAILAPAYPALGRTSMEGVVQVRDIAGERTFAVRDKLHAAGLQPRHIAAGSTSEEVAEALKVSLGEGHRLVYCDAASEADLDAVVRGGRELGVRILLDWIGGTRVCSRRGPLFRLRCSCGSIVSMSAGSVAGSNFRNRRLLCRQRSPSHAKADDRSAGADRRGRVCARRAVTRCD